jgi:hypothetical protein
MDLVFQYQDSSNIGSYKDHPMDIFESVELNQPMLGVDVEEEKVEDIEEKEHDKLVEIDIS